MFKLLKILKQLEQMCFKLGLKINYTPAVLNFKRQFVPQKCMESHNFLMWLFIIIWCGFVITCCSYFIMLCGLFVTCRSYFIMFCGFFIMSCNVVLTLCFYHDVV